MTHGNITVVIALFIFRFVLSAIARLFVMLVIGLLGTWALAGRDITLVCTVQRGQRRISGSYCVLRC